MLPFHPQLYQHGKELLLADRYVHMTPVIEVHTRTPSPVSTGKVMTVYDIKVLNYQCPGGGVA